MELEKIDPHLRMFLDKVGVSECQFRNQDTRDFIYDFIEKHGGMNAIREDINSSIPKTNAQQQLQQQIRQPPTALQRQEYPPPVPARTVPVCIFFIIILLIVVIIYYILLYKMNEFYKQYFYSIKLELLHHCLQIDLMHLQHHQVHHQVHHQFIEHCQLDHHHLL